MRHNPAGQPFLSTALCAAALTVRSAFIVALGGAVTAALGGACGARFNPQGPGVGPANPTASAGPTGQLRQSAGPSGDGALAGDPEPARPPVTVRPPRSRDILIGEMCPRGADGRAAVMPLFLRSTTWSIDGEDVSLPIERRTARSFSVLSWEGRRAGVFSVAGAAEIGSDRRAAIGAYAGESPCAVAADSDASASSKREIDQVCVRAQAECGLAIAAVEATAMRPYEEDPDPLDLAITGACVTGGTLLVDIDGDGVTEAYSAASFLDPVRAPAEEVLAIAAGGLQCAPRFAERRVLRGRNPKHFRGMDLVGAVDIDNDGRAELIVSYHYPERRTWAVYTAGSTVARLDLVGEVVPWPVR